ncbi:hypothetical protein ACFY0F_23575 [Streptomyces sp. NPDC001544]|uniref:hypothetical protein n=1 Tax=Streptomyces sp. NPDC001544 TaxID=3364584 RepID=UPI00368C13B5
MTGLAYVLTHPGFRAVKVGCTTSNSRRLEYFGRRGWEPYRSLAVATRSLARQIEQATLFEIRFHLYVPHYLTENEMRYGGWSETSSLGLITAREVWDVVCEQAAALALSTTICRAVDRRRHNGGTPPRRTPGDAPAPHPVARTQARLERTIEKKD